MTDGSKYHEQTNANDFSSDPSGPMVLSRSGTAGKPIRKLSKRWRTSGVWKTCRSRCVYRDS